MGMLDWLFGPRHRSEEKFPEPRPAFKMQGPILLFGREDYPFDVVGEGLYQAELDDIVGGKSEEGHRHECVAIIVLDNGNPYNEHAVAVSIKSRIIGHFPRQSAEQYREWLREWGLTDAVVSCRSLVVGGRDDGQGETGNYAVKLDIELPFQAT